MAHGEQGQDPVVTGPVPGTWTDGGTGWLAGWYPDPWYTGQRRYWTGQAWTADVRSDDPVGSGTGGSAWPWSTAGASSYGAETGERARSSGPAPAVSTPPVEQDWSGSGRADRSPDGPPWLSHPGTQADQGGPPPGRGASWWILAVAGLAVVALVSGLVAAAITRATRSSSSPPTAAAPSQPAPANPGAGTTSDPDQGVLSGLVARQADVAPTETVQLIPGGDRVVGEPTLDLCNATYASEGLRSARRQVAVADAGGNVVVSTEAVLYQNSAATAQAFAELRAAAAKCPATAVPSPVGEQSVQTTFKPAPDGAWPQVTGVDRQAYDFTTTDATGQTSHSVAVYLRRGRALIGVYFATPDAPQAALAGQTTIPGIVNVSAARLAALPAAVVNRDVTKPSTA